MELNKKYQIGSNKYIEPISILLESQSGFKVYDCFMHRNGIKTRSEYHSLHIETLIKRFTDGRATVDGKQMEARSC